MDASFSLMKNAGRPLTLKFRAAPSPWATGRAPVAEGPEPEPEPEPSPGGSLAAGGGLLDESVPVEEGGALDML